MIQYVANLLDKLSGYFSTVLKYERLCSNSVILLAILLVILYIPDNSTPGNSTSNSLGNSIPDNSTPGNSTLGKFTLVNTPGDILDDSTINSTDNSLGDVTLCDSTPSNTLGNIQLQNYR
jgi:hypothetical protein